MLFSSINAITFGPCLPGYPGNPGTPSLPCKRERLVSILLYTVLTGTYKSLSKSIYKNSFTTFNKKNDKVELHETIHQIKRHNKVPALCKNVKTEHLTQHLLNPLIFSCLKPNSLLEPYQIIPLYP